LIEKIRYSANSSDSIKPEQDNKIDRLLTEMDSSSSDGAEVIRMAREIGVLLQMREIAIKQTRSSA
jgi:uncharacterized protein YacL (UPF0231 family)